MKDPSHCKSQCNITSPSPRPNSLLFGSLVNNLLLLIFTLLDVGLLLHTEGL